MGLIRLKTIPRSWAGGLDQLGFEAGSVSAPAITKYDDGDTGLYFSAADTVDIAAGGIRAAQFATLTSGVNYLKVTPATNAAAATAGVLLESAGTSTNIAIQIKPKGTGGVLGPVGAVGTPAWSFVGRTADGIYSPAANQVGVASTGSLAALFEATAGAPAASATKAVLTLGATAMSGGSASGTYLGANAAVGFGGNLIDLKANGVSLFKVASIANAVNGWELQTAITTATPTLSLIGSDGDIGGVIQSKGTGNLIIRSGGGATGNVYIDVWNGSAFVDLITAASAASPTLTLAAAGGVTVNAAVVLSNAAGTGAGSIATVAGQDLTIDAGTGNLKLTSSASIRLNSTNFAASSGDIIGYQSKPAGNATGTATVYGSQIQPRFNHGVAGGALVGISANPILKGTAAAGGNLTGDVRCIEVKLESEAGGTRTIDSACGIRFNNQLFNTITATNGVFPIRVDTHSNTLAWTALALLPNDGVIAKYSAAHYATLGAIDGAIAVQIGSTILWVPAYVSIAA